MLKTRCTNTSIGTTLNDSAQLYLWQQRTLYIGRLKDTLDVSQGSATLVVSLDTPFSFLTSDMHKPLFCRSLILPAGLSVQINTGNAVVANCNLDALGQDFHVLSHYAQQKQHQHQHQHQHQRLGYNLSNEEELITCFLKMMKSSMNSHQAFTHLNSCFKPDGKSPPHLPAIDPRIKKVIEHIHNTAMNPVNGEELAESVNLSIPRLSQLFKQQTGVTIRRYRLWHRLYLTAYFVGKGMNLTDAAIEAGFTDSPHFAHTFRSMLGMTPSDIFSQTNKIRIIIECEQK